MNQGYWCVRMAMVLALLAGGQPLWAATVTVGRGGNLQAALDAAQAGDTILLEPGAVYSGTFVVRRAVTLRTSGTLPAGRVTPEWSGRLPILRSPTTEPALRTAPGVSQVRIIGLEFAPNADAYGTAILVGSATETDSSRQPRDVVLDRLLVRGHPVNGQKRGLALHASHVTVTRSHISDMKGRGLDTQAIWINNGWGPYTITDNYLEAAGENIMAGGDTPRISQLVPSDIRIEGNTIAKPLRWKAENWTVKNLIELKSARRVIIRGNTLEGSWVSGQAGHGILLTPKDQYGDAPWTTVQDVLVELNIVHEVGEGIRVLGDDHEYPAVRARRITMRHNLLIVDAGAHGGSGRCLTVGRAPQEVDFSFNTCIANGPAAFYTFWGGDVHEIQGGVFRRNVFLHNSYGFSAEEMTAGGSPALTLHYPGGVLAGNLIGGGEAWRYPADSVLEPADFRAQFDNYAGGDFRLTSTARVRFADAAGTSPGVDFTALSAATAAAPVVTGDTVVSAPDPEPVQAPSTALPAGWASADVGSVSPAGWASASGGTFTMAGAGADIWGSSDAFHFAYRQLTGDATITARVSAIDPIDPWTKAGVMMRETLGASSAHAMLIVSPSKGVAFQRRTAAGGTSTHTGGGSATAPVWLRLTRSGSTVSAYASADGTHWTLVGFDSVPMSATIHVGLGVTSHRNGSLARATIDHVDTAAATAAPAWQNRDIGSVSPRGSASIDGSTFALAGAGADIWNGSDAFHFAYRALSGDGAITARVAALDAVDAWTKAGVMMRETLTAGSRHAMMIVSPSKGLAFQRRLAPGGESTHTGGGSGAAPAWVRLVRDGHTFRAYMSRDGSSWTLVGSESIPMAETIYVGLAITSHRDGTLARTTIDNVTINGQ